MPFEIFLFLLQLYLVIGALYAFYGLLLNDVQTLVKDKCEQAVKGDKTLNLNTLSMLVSLATFALLTVTWLPIIVLFPIFGIGVKK